MAGGGGGGMIKQSAGGVFLSHHDAPSVGFRQWCNLE